MSKLQASDSGIGTFFNDPSIPSVQSKVESFWEFNLKHAKFAKNLYSFYSLIDDISSTKEEESEIQSYMTSVALGAGLSTIQKMIDAIEDIQNYISPLLNTMHLIGDSDETCPSYPYMLAAQDLSQYSPGYAGECLVTANLGNNQIYITLDISIQEEISCAIKDYLERKEYQSFTEKPNYGEVFAIEIENEYRRVMVDPTLSNKTDSFSIFLLDYGEVLHNITSTKRKLYRLGKKLQRLRSQVIFCRLQYSTIDISEALANAKQINFFVNDVIGKMLIISLYTDKTKNPFVIIRPNQSTEEVDKVSELLSNKIAWSSQETIDTNPFNCTKETMDSDFKNKDKINFHYDSKGNLGNTNIASHESWGQAPSDECSKFHQKVDYLYLDDIAKKEYNVGDKFSCRLTHFFKVATVFGFDTDYENNLTKIEDYLNSIDWVLRAQKLDETPSIHMRVVAPYIDNCFYRAKIVHIYPDYIQQVKVFYLDYGNFNTVRVDELKKWDHQLSKMKPKIIPLRIARIENPEDAFDLIVKREKLNKNIGTFGPMTAKIIDCQGIEKVVELTMDDGTNFVEFLTGLPEQ